MGVRIELCLGWMSRGVWGELFADGYLRVYVFESRMVVVDDFVLAAMGARLALVVSKLEK